VGKPRSALEMLTAGRTPSAPTKQLDDQLPTPSSSDADPVADIALRRLVDVTTSGLDVETSSSQDAGSTSSSNTAATSALVAKSPTYQRQTVFLTPDLRGWLKETAKAMPVDGLSASDVVRLALNELRRHAGEGSIDLVSTLTTQAHQEASTMAGRRNRGLPPTP